MTGIWFNHEDICVRSKKHEDLTILHEAGYTDAYILIKGMDDDIRNTPIERKRVLYLFETLKKMGLRTHGVFICSNDRAYCKQYPDRADMTIFGNKSAYRISHTDPFYLSYLKESIISAAREFPMDGVQLDFMRYGIITNGWSGKEEEIYAQNGTDVPMLKEKILRLYDSRKEDYNIKSLLDACQNGDSQLMAFSDARRSIIRNFVRSVTDEIRTKLPDKEISIAMMPEGLWPERYSTALLHYGQTYEDLQPYADHLFAMAYAGSYNVKSDWVGEIGKQAQKRIPRIVMGLECTEPRSSSDISTDLSEISGLNHAGVCFFRYGRMIIGVTDGRDTLLYNSYPGTVRKLELYSGEKKTDMECRFEEASYMRIPGKFDRIRAFGSFKDISGRDYDGEFCVVADVNGTNS
ncbi:hypothetical protein [[Clostridium] aminophilum]|uniref:hypothetical protein n=1 Tax=[Clostridium] aminophilum TaxID=1526 RepID=UPI00332E0570